MARYTFSSTDLEIQGVGQATVNLLGLPQPIVVRVNSLAITDAFLLTGSGNDQLEGSTGNDTLQAGNGNDTLDGKDGEDILQGEDGDDSLDGGNGNDSLEGGIGNDTLVAFAGNDTLRGGEGNDSLVPFTTSLENTVISGDAGNDTIEGGNANGNDLIAGNAGNDDIKGGAGNDTIDGGLDNDKIDGGAGNDSVVGGEGDDSVTVDISSDFADGGPGLDDLIASFTIVEDIADNIGNFRNFELLNGNPVGAGTGNNILGTPGSDTIDSVSSLGVTGTPGNFSTNFNDTIDGGDGDDTIFGLGGNDSILGGDDSDSILGGAGSDTINGEDDTDILTGGLGADVFQIDESDEDSITDFSLSEGDTIQLLSSEFPGGTGTLPILETLGTIDTGFNNNASLAGLFVEGLNTPLGQDGTPIYFYEATSGRFLIDEDGTNPSSTFELIAQLPLGLSSSVFINISIVPTF